MNERFNKPIVFLSHSKKDKSFINELYNDLLKCQISPWLDEIEIRHGKPWLDSIFEHGIPTCDSALVYLTQNSIESKMVKKEIDASLITELSDNSITFLPYVSDTKIRSYLRSDLQTLQILEWNIQNYKELLPSVVAEIWRSFMERNIVYAVQNEQNKRLKLEIEVQRLKHAQNSSVFSQSEEADFSYIHSCFNKQLCFDLSEYSLKQIKNSVTKDEKISSYKFSLSLGDLISQLIYVNSTDFKMNTLKKVIKDHCIKIIAKKRNKKIEKTVYEIDGLDDINSQLLTFGLVQGVYVPEQRYKNGSTSLTFKSAYYRYPFTNKLYRFRYWLEYNKKLNYDLVLNHIDEELFMNQSYSTTFL